ncbi:MAG: LPS export ABC transporter ATP-binding protein [Rickettsiales bacterium]|jgi:lipopolysaccharide export system ATP-binding protein|nr:LPS export ABC transporter ATP-binding protein [Rickettsiales bacterium]
MIGSNILKVEHLRKSYGEKVIVQDVGLEIRGGEIVGLLGPNGAGKTTIFYMIVGMMGVDDGQITLNGNNISQMPMYQRARMGLGYLPQETSIFRGMTVSENILCALEVSQTKTKIQKLEQLISNFSISHIKNSSAAILSGGERRRVEIARTLALDPSFMLLDEPFAGRDPIAMGDIANTIVKLKNMGIGILITDHNIRETLALVDRAYIVYNGKILAFGGREEILNNEDVKKFYLGENFIS